MDGSENTGMEIEFNRQLNIERNIINKDVDTYNDFETENILENSGKVIFCLSSLNSHLILFDFLR